MRLTYRVNIGEKAFQRLAFLAGEVSERSAKAFGTIYVRAMAAVTPPHDGKADAQEALANRKHENIMILRERIAQNIAGFDPNKEKHSVLVVPYRNISGEWMPLDIRTRRPAKPMGAFGIFVPLRWEKVKKKTIPESKPEQVYAGAKWDGKKMVPQRWRKHFVRHRALAAFVKKQQSHAGKLISGWAPAARVFAVGKSIANGLFENLGGKGFGRLYNDNKGRTRGVMINRQPYNAAQAALIKRRMRLAVSKTKEVRAVQIRQVLRWYKKKAKEAMGVN